MAVESCRNNAKERRDIATVDIHGAFKQADMDEIVHVRFEGAMTELLVKLDPKLHRKYIINDHPLRRKH